MQQTLPLQDVVLEFSPGPIHAEDGDRSLDTPLTYTLLSGEGLTLMFLCIVDIILYVQTYATLLYVQMLMFFQNELGMSCDKQHIYSFKLENLCNSP